MRLGLCGVIATFSAVFFLGNVAFAKSKTGQMRPGSLTAKQAAVHKMARGQAKRLELYEQSWGYPVVAGLVVDGKLIWAQGVGHRDVGQKAPMTPATVGRVGSITKVFTGLAVLTLLTRGWSLWMSPSSAWCRR